MDSQARREGAETTLGTGERKPVTILFADIVGSTQKAEALDPEAWREVVAGAHERVGEAVGRYEGTVAQLLGDGVLAFFGAPTTHEDDPGRAVRAALDLQEAIWRYGHELSGFVDDFAMRVGIHTGTVVVGELGSAEKSEYLAVGDAVNVASRLQGAAQPGQIVVSDQIARRVQASFDLEDIGSLELKGKSNRVQAFVVHGPKAEPGRARGLEAAERVFVGRQQELKELQQSILQLCRGHGGIRFILGEAGIGKSRLVEELRGRPGMLAPGSGAYLASPEQVKWVEGRALSYGTGLSFWLIIQLLLSDLDLSEGAPTPMIRAALRARLEGLFPQGAEDSEPFLNRLLGLKLKPEHQQRLAAYDGETLRHETFRAIESYFDAAALQTPMVLVLEDLHWADASSLEALEQLLRVTDRAPLMVLGLMRLERDHGSWALRLRAETDFDHRYEEIRLHRLGGSDAEQLLVRVLGEGSQESGVASLVLSKAEGNPFYLEELLRHLIEQRLIVLEDGKWKATAELERVGIPETLQGVVLARIDRLEEDVQHTLQLASVIGRSFLYRLLQVISGEQEKLQTHLSQLQRVDLVREKERLPELEYVFKHAMTREAAYSSLLVERRMEFHRRVAQAVEALYPDRLDEYTGLLAYHYEAAGENEKAIKYLSAAVDQARLQDSLEEAKDLLRRLIALLEQDSREDTLARAWMKLGLVHQTNFEFSEAHRAYEKAFELEERLGARSEVPSIRGADNTTEGPVLRIPVFIGTLSDLHLNDVNSIADARLRMHLQAGLAKLDRELNVVPHAARSWEVHEEGRLYLFHLREDLRWNDGDRVTAGDYLDYWRWQLSNADASKPSWLSVIAGVNEFQNTAGSTSDLIGMRERSDTSFELRLKEPVAHFLYLIAQNAYPAPAGSLREHGENWWRPPHGLFSGPFVIDQWGEHEAVLRRNPHFFGRRRGNLQAVHFIEFDSPKDIERAYQANLVDIRGIDRSTSLPERIPQDEIQSGTPTLLTSFAMFNPHRAPTNDRRFRVAFARSLDRAGVPMSLDGRVIPAGGGLVPPRLPGHTPDLGFHIDTDRGRELMDELRSGEPGLPRSMLVSRPSNTPYPDAVLDDCARELGVEFEYHTYQLGQLSHAFRGVSPHIHLGGWVADYPDPYTFLVTMVANNYRWLGWSDPGFDSLVNQLSGVSNRKKRLELFRRMDHYLVRDQALVMPIFYGGTEPYLVKPWIKGYSFDALSMVDLENVTILDHANS